MFVFVNSNLGVIPVDIGMLVLLPNLFIDLFLNGLDSLEWVGKIDNGPYVLQ